MKEIEDIAKKHAGYSDPVLSILFSLLAIYLVFYDEWKGYIYSLAVASTFIAFWHTAKKSYLQGFMDCLTAKIKVIEDKENG